MKLSGREKATIFLSILGPDTSAQILRYLPGELADMIATGINQLPMPTPEALGAVLNDFKGFLALPAPGTVKSRSAEPTRFDMPLEKMPPKEILLTAPVKRLAFILSDESPQMAAFVLSFFPEDRRDDVLVNLPHIRPMTEAMLAKIKKSMLSSKFEEKLIKHFADKIWA